MKKWKLHIGGLFSLFVACFWGATVSASGFKNSSFQKNKTSVLKRGIHPKSRSKKNFVLIPYEKLSPHQRFTISRLIGLIRGGDDNFREIFNLVDQYPEVIRWQDQDRRDPLTFVEVSLISSQNALKFDKIFGFLWGIKSSQVRGRKWDKWEGDLKTCPSSKKEDWILDNSTFTISPDGKEFLSNPFKIWNELNNPISKDKSGELVMIPSITTTAYGSLNTRWLTEKDGPIPTGIIDKNVDVMDPIWRERWLNDWQTFIRLFEKVNQREALAFMKRVEELKQQNRQEMLKSVTHENFLLRKKIAVYQEAVSNAFSPALKRVDKQYC